MQIQVEEIKDLMHLISSEIKSEVKWLKDEHTAEMTFQEHTMGCERSWEEGYDKGFQDAKNELKDEAEKNCKVNEAVIKKICKATENWINSEYAPRLQRWIEEQIIPKCKEELKNKVEEKVIGTQKSLEDLTPALPVPSIDRITEERINRHFCIPPEHFGHHGFLYKLSEKEYCKAMAFINKMYNKHDRNNELTYCYQPVSTGIGIAISIVCDQHPEEQEDITDYSRW